MKLTLERNPSGVTCTLGSLFIDDVFECFTLEDVVREVPGMPVESWKIKGQTAIPAGTYRTQITLSNRFKKRLPILAGVAGFEGVRIHSGNTDADTEGCVLVGRNIAAGVEAITESRLALQSLMEKMDAAIERGEDINIEILNAA